MVRLRGTTWNHTRGYAPLVAAAKSYQIGHPEVEIQWERRPLQDLADFPIETLAQTYDMVIIDHPSVGGCACSRCILPLDELLPGEAHTDSPANKRVSATPQLFAGSPAVFISW